MNTNETTPLKDPPPHPYISGEQPLTGWRKTLLPCLWLLLIVLLPVRLVLLVVSVALSTLVCKIVTFGAEKEITGLRRSLMLWSHFVLSRLVMVAFGIWPGLLTVKGELDPSASVVVFGPHVGLLDGLFWLHFCAPRPIVLETYTKIPGLSAVFKACSGLAVPVASGKARTPTRVQPETPSETLSTMGADAAGQIEPSSSHAGSATTSAIRATILEHKRSFVRGRAPICLLPEGITHNGLTMLKFFPGSFEGGTPVQPVVLSYPFKYINSHSFLSDVGTHLLKMLLSPYIVLNVRLLPLYVPSEAEKADAALMAEGVRAKMAEALGIPLSTYGAKDLRREWSAARAKA
uniref:Phospholipid/glycerol acyltransferase domain-containing protein n=1 Tax=Chrysotila carterae TaxID=13221 RepID=A0A7S4B054_CHRCT|mmetsp:Transcript_1675/g.3218  ORF Transcript_1675/g.3218 Transcript_1675/m.3218 type:complete len:348 (+) Transcript_1675:352-1395(+)